MKKTIQNRYNETFTFTFDADNMTILWEGNFTYCRIGYPNDYSKAFNSFIEDYPEHEFVKFHEFKELIHEYDEENRCFKFPKQAKMIETLTDQIDMVDPSGGPYISVGDVININEIQLCVASMKNVDTGYLLTVTYV
jgi:hypothetical protein